jgi:hypothetical protein
MLGSQIKPGRCAYQIVLSRFLHRGVENGSILFVPGRVASIFMGTASFASLWFYYTIRFVSLQLPQGKT